ncbi:MAG: type II toxin-antitoxin system VapC family toxin [Rhizobiales bacterium]|nr:type II toxin-antitoxin system VapC family toxin [Hyphomicrobiales bacterium]
MNWDAFTGDTIYLDTNILILAVEGGSVWSESLREMFVCIDDNAIHAFTSELTFAEVLAKPLAVEATGLVKAYEELLAPTSVIRVVPIDRAILASAAALQGKLAIKLMDAIHVATAVSSACDFFFTGDTRLGQRIKDDIRWLPLDEVNGSGDD